MAKKSARNEDRVQRRPLGGRRLKLQLSDEDMAGFKRRKTVGRWVNDQDGRVQAALNGGYTFVKQEHAMSLGHGALHAGSTDEGSKVSKVVSRGKEVITAYLMEIPEKYWREDQQAKEDTNRLVDETLAAGNAGGAKVENQYGTGVTYSR